MTGHELLTALQRLPADELAQPVYLITPLVGDRAEYHELARIERWLQRGTMLTEASFAKRAQDADNFRSIIA